ncbi:MAG: hypothetical protein JJ895_13305 [Balneolaceae bacterium]|nr:hypothetical protein [Balneolaceae bacterium]
MNISRIEKQHTIYEVGKGSGFTSEYLNSKGYSIKTIDIDENKNPDLLLDITKDQIPTSDAYIAFEILEHIPFLDAEKFIKTLKDNGTKYLVFSLPYAFKTFIWIEGFLLKYGGFKINLGKKRKSIISEHHYWELGINGHNVKSIKGILGKYNFKVVKDYKYRNHHFFVAEQG